MSFGLLQRRVASEIIRCGRNGLIVSKPISIPSRARSSTPSSYNIPLRPVSLDDTMEPYGDFKVAYEAERKNANKILARGVICFAASCAVFYYSGVMDGLWMPNLDNIMEETESFHQDLEGRVTVR